MKPLRIAAGLALDPEFVTKTAAILAQRRKGKTYTASVLAEEFVAASMPFVALDPTGAWWGLRFSADDKTEGLPVTILGGEHGDVPIEPHDGPAVAELVVDEPGYYVIDFSLFESRTAERSFAAGFGERLYRRKGQANSDFPLHLFVDEADMFVPQEKEHGDQRMLGAFQAIVRRGGLRGLGTTLISQRPALVNKNVLTQLDVLIMLRLVAGNDIDYVDKHYIKRQSDPEMRSALMDSLAGLKLGEAWVWEPGADPTLFERVQIRERHTFNSSATPKAGKRPVQPRRMAPVEIEAVKKRLAETIERAKAEDPAELRKHIAQLERERRLEQARPAETTIRQVPFVPAELAEQVQLLETHLTDMIGNAQGVLTDVRQAADRARVACVIANKVDTKPLAAASAAPSPARDISRAPAKVTVGESVTAVDVTLGKGEKKVLAVLAEFSGGRTYNELAFLAGYSSKASTLGVYLAELRKKGLVEPGGAGAPIRATPEGLAAAGGARPPLHGDALLDHWLRHPRMGKGERAVLEVLIDQYPRELTHEELCGLTGYSPDASTIGVYQANLRKLGLMEKGRRLAAREFMEAIGA